MPSREQELFSEALEQPADCRTAFLDDAAPRNSVLRARVESLLAAATRVGGFLGGDEVELTEAPGARIGPYRLVERLGEGGFGVVYRAEQEQPVRRTVALKIVKLGMDTRAVIARFAAERQALALMDHPHIARVLDAGATESGRPFFVMELVEGEPLAAFCRARNLPVRARFALFLQVCAAVQHAHQKGIIHRDLKPSNVLVTEKSGVPLAKVIDFGVAKATREPLTGDGASSRLLLFIGTPAYMSPEQFGRVGQDVDTRADIYSLGAVLYEMLTEATPFDGAALGAAGFTAMERTLRQTEPVAPSKRLAGLSPAALAAVASARGTDGPRLCRLVRGDLDQIVLKCLEKDRARRYATVHALARDIERFLADEPVQARPATPAYRAGKFFRRHRRGVAAAGAALALALFLGVYHTRRLAIERDRAQAEAAKARKVSELLTGVLTAADPFRSPGEGATNIPGMLANAADRARREFAREPDVRADVLSAVGRLHLRVGRYPEAQRVLEEALAASRETGARDARLALALSDLGVLHRELGRDREAVACLEEALTIRRTLHPEPHNDVAITLVELSRAHRQMERLDRAEPLSREALAIRRAALGEHRETATSQSDLGLLFWQQGKISEAEELLTECLAMTRRMLGEEHPNTAYSRSNLALIAESRGDFVRAEKLLGEALPVFQRTLGERQWRTARALAQLAGLERAQGQLEVSGRRLDDALAMVRETLGPDHLQTALTEIDRARTHLAAGEAADAENLLRRALTVQMRMLPAGGWRVAVTKGLLGEALAAQGRTEEAEKLLVEAVAVLPEVAGPRGADTAHVRASLAALCARGLN
jgi:serine/threonine protein kinase